MGTRAKRRGPHLVAVNDTNQMDNTKMVRRLRELIMALDRRVPQVQRAGEGAIASDAAALRARALERIAELQHDPAPPERKL